MGGRNEYSFTGRPLVYWFLSFLEPKRALLDTPLTKWTYGQNNPTKGEKGQFKMDSAYC